MILVLREKCFLVLMKKWPNLAHLFLSHGFKQCKYDTNFLAFLSIWKKLIKYTRTSDFDLEDEELEDMIDNGLLMDHLEHLISMLESGGQSVLMWNKIIDLLNQGLPYGAMMSKRENFEPVQQKLALGILRSVQRGLLDKVPKQDGLSAFGGNEYCESADQDSSTCCQTGDSQSVIDSRTLRKMTLLILRACAAQMKISLGKGMSHHLTYNNLSIWARKHINTV